VIFNAATPAIVTINTKIKDEFELLRASGK
jgi:hypothetical protein